MSGKQSRYQEMRNRITLWGGGREHGELPDLYNAIVEAPDAETCESIVSNARPEALAQVAEALEEGFTPPAAYQGLSPLVRAPSAFCAQLIREDVRREPNPTYEFSALLHARSPAERQRQLAWIKGHGFEAQYQTWLAQQQQAEAEHKSQRAARETRLRTFEQLPPEDVVAKIDALIGRLRGLKHIAESQSLAERKAVFSLVQILDNTLDDRASDVGVNLHALERGDRYYY
jgi:hypothetical protein